MENELRELKATVEKEKVDRQATFEQQSRLWIEHEALVNTKDAQIKALEQKTNDAGAMVTQRQEKDVQLQELQDINKEMRLQGQQVEAANLAMHEQLETAQKQNSTCLEELKVVQTLNQRWEDYAHRLVAAEKLKAKDEAEVLAAAEKVSFFLALQLKFILIRFQDKHAAELQAMEDQIAKAKVRIFWRITQSSNFCRQPEQTNWRSSTKRTGTSR